MADKIITGGAWVQVVIDGQPIGLTTQASYTEDWGIAPANVLGVLGPMDYDSQNYSCQVSIGTFLPELPGGSNWPDGGVVSLTDLLPTRRNVQANGGKPGQFDLLQFMNIATQGVIVQFRAPMISNNGVQVNPNAYVMTNVSFMSLERVEIV